VIERELSALPPAIRAEVCAYALAQVTPRPPGWHSALSARLPSDEREEAATVDEEAFARECLRRMRAMTSGGKP
jgi:hypothetical protein